MNQEPTYFSRESQPNPDGGAPLFRNKEDADNEKEVAEKIEAKMPDVKLKPWGTLSPIDFWVLKNRIMVGIVEVKGRSHTHDTHPDIFFNCRKWLTMTAMKNANDEMKLEWSSFELMKETSIAMKIEAHFFIKFMDRIGFISLSDIDPTYHSVSGCRRVVKSEKTDIEPVIRILIDDLSWLDELEDITSSNKIWPPQIQ